jgi:hypothetical protein
MADTSRYPSLNRVHRALAADLPSLRTAVGQRILHRFVQLYGAQLEAVSDADFLEMRNFGPAMLALLRTVVPTPVPASVPGDDWDEHAEMVAFVELRHG